MPPHIVPASCVGERCLVCWHFLQTAVPATHKLGEEILEGDADPIRHPLTAYVCCQHFQMVFGLTACSVRATDVTA